MTGPPIIRATVQPRLLADGSLATIRMAGGGDRVPYKFGGVDYRSGIVDFPPLGSSFGWDEDGWTGDARAQSATLAWAPSLPADLANFASLYLWKDAPITVERGEEGVAAGATLTNYLLQSQDFSSWSSFGYSPVVANVETAPNCTKTADRLFDARLVGQNPGRYQTTGAAPSGLGASSIFAKAGTAPRLGVRVYDGAAYHQKATFDLVNGLVVDNAAGAASMVYIGDGWWRCIITGTTANSPLAGSWTVEALEAGRSVQDSYNASGTGYVSVWQGQFLAGSYPDGGPIVQSDAAFGQLVQGAVGVEPASWTTLLSGTVAGMSSEDGQLRLTIADNAVKLSKPFLLAHYLGTGGIEGPAEMESMEKRRSFGYCFNVEGRILDKANNIWEFGDPSKPFQSITAVRDFGRAAVPAPATVAWQGSIAATFAALQAASAVQGSGVVAPSIACIKWWTQPVGPLTADIIGEGAYGNTAYALAKHIANDVGISIQAAAGSLVTMMANTANAGIHFDNDRMTGAEGIDKLLLGAGCFWGFTPGGNIDVRPIEISNPVETIQADRIARQRIFPPHKARRMGYMRNNRIHSDGEIAAVLLVTDISDFSEYTSGLGANLLPDDQFTTGLWGTIGPVIPVRVPGDASGTFKQAARFYVAEINLTGGGGTFISQPDTTFPATPGKRYWMGARVAKSVGAVGNNSTIAIHWWDSSGVYLGLFSTVTTTIASLPADGSYKAIFGSGIAPANAAFGRAWFSADSTGGSGKIRYDAPFISEIEPSADVTSNAAAIGDGNRVRYSLFESGTIGWKILYNPSGLAVLGNVVGEAAPYRYYQAALTFTAASQVFSIGTDFSNKGTRIPVIAGERISIQARVGADYPGAGSGGSKWELYTSYLDFAGAGIAGSGQLIASGTNEPFGQLCQAFQTVPAGATSLWLELYVYNGTALGAGSASIMQAMVSSAGALQVVHPNFIPGPSHEYGADVTTTIVGPTSGNINYDYSGATIEQSQDFNFYLAGPGGLILNDLTVTANILVTDGQINAVNSASGVQGLPVSNSVATLTVNSLPTDTATADISLTRNGTTRKTTIILTKIKAAQPPSGGGGGGYATSQTSGFPALLTPWTGFVNALTDRIQITMPAGKTMARIVVSLSGKWLAKLQPNEGPWNLEYKIQRNTGTTGSPIWTDIGAAQNSNPDPYLDSAEFPISVAGSLIYTFDDTGRTAGSIYEYRVVTRVSSGATAGNSGGINYSGSVSVSAP